MSRQCPICKQHVGFNEARRLYFSKGSDLPVNPGNLLIQELNETIETVTCDLTVARELCSELTDSLVITELKNKQVHDKLQQTQKELSQLSDTLVKEKIQAAEKSAAELEEVRRVFMGKLKALEEENKKEKEARIKEQRKYDQTVNGWRKKEKLAQDRLKRLSSEKKNLIDKLGRLESEDNRRKAAMIVFDNMKKEPPVESTKVQTLESQLLQLKQQIQQIEQNQQQNKQQHKPKQFNNNKQNNKQKSQSKQQNHNKHDSTQQSSNKHQRNNKQQHDNASHSNTRANDAQVPQKATQEGNRKSSSIKKQQLPATSGVERLGVIHSERLRV
jgi:DNA repair exonuclease SbcCD ATPase subunit